MATEVLRPHDILIQRFRVSPSACYCRRTNFGNGNGNDYFNPRSSYGNRKQVVKPERERSEKKKTKNQPDELLMKRRSVSSEDLRPMHNAGKSNAGIVMGQVTILRRGESLDSLIPVTRKIGPVQPEMMSPKQIRVGLSSADVYAGSAFSNSPSPRALPLPSFFNKKHDDFKSFDDFATRDLRRLLRLEY